MMPRAAREEDDLETDRQIWTLGGHCVCPLKLVVRFQHLSQTGKLRLKLWIKRPLKSSRKNRFLFINKYQSGLTFLSQQEILENNVAETPE